MPGRVFAISASRCSIRTRSVRRRRSGRSGTRRGLCTAQRDEWHDLEGALLDLRGDLTPRGVVGRRERRGAQRLEAEEFAQACLPTLFSLHDRRVVVGRGSVTVTQRKFVDEPARVGDILQCHGWEIVAPSLKPGSRTSDVARRGVEMSPIRQKDQLRAQSSLLA